MMRKAFFTLTIAAGFFIGMTACGGEADSSGTEAQTEDHSGHNHDADGTEHSEENAEMAEASYYCPMKCEGEKTYDAAGSCAVCGMDLVAAE